VIATRLTRRTLVAGGLLGTAALSGCSVSDLTSRKLEDPEAADRLLLAEARDLAAQRLAMLEANAPSHPHLAELYRTQIGEFTRAANLPTAVTPSRRAAADDRHLAQTMRGLALKAQRGDVAALLASAAAGIAQALVR